MTFQEIVRVFNTSDKLDNDFIISHALIGELQSLYDNKDAIVLEGMAQSLTDRAQELYNRHFKV